MRWHPIGVALAPLETRDAVGIPSVLHLPLGRSVAPGRSVFGSLHKQQQLNLIHCTFN